MTEAQLSLGYDQTESDAVSHSQPGAASTITSPVAVLWWPARRLVWVLPPTPLWLLCCRCGLHWLWITTCIPSSFSPEVMLNRVLGLAAALSCQEVCSRT